MGLMNDPWIWIVYIKEDVEMEVFLNIMNTPQAHPPSAPSQI